MNINRFKSLALTGMAVAAMFGISACSGGDVVAPGPGQGTGSANAEQPAPPAPEPGTIEAEAPEGGAAARIGSDESTISHVACTVINGVWSMSGGDDDGTKVAVTGPEDRGSVDTASIVMPDGTVVQVTPGKGSADIAWDGEEFTVTGVGQVLDLNDPEAEHDDSDFVIQAACE